MANCSNDLWAQRLKDLLLPGSHNAHAYAFHPHRLGAPLPKMLQLISPLLSPLVSAWGKAQSVPVLGQLLLGSRYLDIRIDKSTLCGTFFTTHGMAGPSLIAILSAVSSFLRNEHFQNELLVLDVQKTHSIESSSDHEAVLDEIATYLSDLLVPATQGLAELTYGECISSNKRVVVLYGGARDDDDIAASALERNVWPRHDCFLWSPWPKSRSLSQLREHFKVAPKLAKRAPGFFVLQGVCTPNAQIVQQGVLKRSAPSDLHELAQAVTPTAFGWARELEMSCVVMCDYIDCCAGEIALMLAERYPTFAERLALQYREAKSKVE